MTAPANDHPTSAEDEVVQLCSELIRIDTTNTGDPETLAGEAEAADYVADKLREVGYDVELVESGMPKRMNVIARLEGADRTRGALLMHGHLDVVPADASEWSVHLFSGAVQDGYVWGRGAADMKDMDAMMLAVARRFKREGVVRRGTSCGPSSPTRRRAGSGARSGWWRTGRTCSKAAPRPSVRSAGSPDPG